MDHKTSCKTIKMPLFHIYECSLMIYFVALLYHEVWEKSFYLKINKTSKHFNRAVTLIIKNMKQTDFEKKLFKKTRFYYVIVMYSILI